MAFPPTFTDVWDITQPPDTQLLNQGALDFRSLKNDIMQRMSLLSGTTANRPTPETVNATWGGSGFGLVFFATDTGILYQWNGSAWVILTAFNAQTGLGNSISQQVILANTSVNVFFTLPIAGNLLPINGGFECTFYTSTQSSIVSLTLFASFGGTQFAAGSISSNAFGGMCTIKIYNAGVTNSQATFASFFSGISTSTLAIDTTTSQNFVLSYQLGNSSDSTKVKIGGISVISAL